MLYEIIFEYERFDLVGSHDIPEIGDLCHEQLRFFGLRGGRTEILSHAVTEYLRLAHVKHLPEFVEHYIYAARKRKRFKFLVKIDHTDIIIPLRKKSNS